MIINERNAAAAAQIAAIANQTQARLAELKVTYAIADGIKSGAGWTAIIAMCSLAILIVSVDIFNFIVYLLGKNSQTKLTGKKSPSKKIKPVYVARRRF